MTTLYTRPKPLDPLPSAIRPSAADLAHDHSDQRFADRDRREAAKTSMMKVRSWTIGAVIAGGTILWFLLTS